MKRKETLPPVLQPSVSEVRLATGEAGVLVKVGQAEEAVSTGQYGEGHIKEDG